MHLKTILTLTIATSLLLGCSGGSNVSRISTQKEVALSDRWNDQDSRLVSDEMITDMLSYPWLERFSKEHPNKPPTIVIQRVQNKSHEHIAIDTFINDLKRAVIRSGKADFIVSGEEREAVRDELKQQDLHANEQTRMDMGEEQGANFALSGSINSIVDQVEGTRVTFYQVDLKLINLQTTREVWNGQQKIKKLMEKSRFGF